MTSPIYRVLAVQYATRNITSSEAFYGDREQTPMTLDYFVWALRHGDQTVIVDLGFTEPVGARRGRERRYLRPVDQGLAELRIDPASVEHVIVTHLHFDHTGYYALFPNATFHLQDADMRFYTGRNARHPLLRNPIEADDVAAFVRLNFDGRVALADGDEEVAPGIGVHHVGGHTAGMQIVSVATERGTAVLASDASHFYANFERTVPFPVLHDLPGTYYAFDRIRALAGAPDLIVPGHDPLVHKRLRTVGPNILEL